MPELEIFGLTATAAKRGTPWNPATAMPDIAPADTSVQDDVIIGTSPAIQRTKRLLEKAAPFSEPVMLLGESGTGKAFFARHLHMLGATPEGPFVAVNCAALSPGSAGSEEDELLGEEGLLAQAKGGTLFLNALLSLSEGHQARLASLITEDDRRLRETRIISALGVSPVEAIRKGAFRSDLHTLLSVLPIEIPALRDRRDDIPLLVSHFLAVHRKRLRRTVAGLSGAGFDALLRYDYPGNVRELSNLLRRGMIYAEPGAFIEINHMFSALETLPEIAKTAKFHAGGAVSPPEEPGQSMMESLELELLRTTLTEVGWNVSEAARKLRVSRAKVDYRIKKFNLKPGPSGKAPRGS
ncbi:sigma 54-interacting transcriptional regulator [Litorisediminicola beolgyonensis]|uniref:Sigma 54-interacting transcriptional regulator n=1 Tax=Litorisediminicola beolgyonensis TaxID=1173614 RepID=A0ABW3ZGK6_9RHOB